MATSRINIAVEKFARSHLTLSKTSLRTLLIISLISWFGSWAFGALCIEELVQGCLNHPTLLQSFGLNMSGINKYCSNTPEHTYLTTSLIEIGGAFAYGVQSWFLTGFSYSWIRRLSQ